MALQDSGVILRLQSEILPESESAASKIGHISLGMKSTGKPGAGNPHAGFDVAGAGNGLKSTAPVFDPSCEGERQRCLSLLDHLIKTKLSSTFIIRDEGGLYHQAILQSMRELEFGNRDIVINALRKKVCDSLPPDYDILFKLAV